MGFETVKTMTAVKTVTKEKQQRKELPAGSSPYSSSSSPAVVAVMAVALSLATYLYNSLMFHGSDPVVPTSLGLVQGSLAHSREGRPYYEFLGLPYADSPVGHLRFEVC